MTSPPDHRPRRAAKKRRLDELLVERGLAAHLDDAHIAIREGRVHGPNRRYEKPGEAIPADLPLTVKPAAARFVSRGGEKLLGALEDFRVSPLGLRAVDLGSSTGGFTDCLLQLGAKRILAVDVGRGQLHDRMRRDPRVISREGTDLRTLTPEQVRVLLGGDWGIVVGDLSFISLVRCLEFVSPLVLPTCEAILLIKPQFELPRDQVPDGGVVNDEALEQEAVKRVLTRAEGCGLLSAGVTLSRLRGADGNREYFVHWRRAPQEPPREPLA